MGGREGGRGEGESGGEEERRFYPSLVSNIVCVQGFLSLSFNFEVSFTKGIPAKFFGVIPTRRTLVKIIFIAETS